MAITTGRALGAELRAARMRAGMTQHDLADRASIARRTVVSVEGGRPADTTTLLALLRALDLELQLVPSTPAPDPFAGTEEV